MEKCTVCTYLHIKGVGVEQPGSHMNFFLEYYVVRVKINMD
jgi:hypothetical protein